MLDYSFWKASLAGERPEIHVDRPQLGLYKARRRKDGPMLPVVIWADKETGEIKARWGRDVGDPAKVWTYCADKPITKADYEHYQSAGMFPGEIAPIGHNALSLADEIADAVEQAQAWLARNAIADKVTADTASNMRERLRKLAKKADDEREEKRRPHREAADAIQQEYLPLIESAKGAANALGGQLAKYLAEEDAKAKAEHAAKIKAADAYTDVGPTPPPKVQAGGQAGRKTGLKTVTKFRVIDAAAMLEAVKDHEEVLAAAQKVAFARMRTGVQVPGVEAFTEQVAT